MFTTGNGMLCVFFHDKNKLISFLDKTNLELSKTSGWIPSVSKTTFRGNYESRMVTSASSHFAWVQIPTGF